MKNQKTWIAIFAILIIACVLLIYLRHGGEDEAAGKIAFIYVNGEVFDEIDLDSVSEPHSITINHADGAYNTVYIEPGAISVSAASCPDQVCVRHAPISDGTEPVVCLPNRVVIQIKSEGVADAVAGGG